MNNSSKTFAEQGVKECIGLAFHTYKDSVIEWADQYVETLWENRTEIDEARDVKGDVTLSDYIKWSREKALELMELSVSQLGQLN